MVQAIKQNIGMNVVMDVVYNHTNEAGLGPKSVRQDECPGTLPAPEPGDRLGGKLPTCCSNIGTGTRHVRQADG